MGGEQSPILVYGSTERYEMKQWIVKLKLIDVHEFAQSIKNEKDYDFENMSDEEIFDEYYEDFENLLNFIEENGFTNVFFNNYDWTEFSIGLDVYDFERVTQKEKEKVKEFCEKYNLTTPTFYAGIVGELE
jgi:Cft2 family RNA processing exonuclease